MNEQMRRWTIAIPLLVLLLCGSIPRHAAGQEQTPPARGVNLYVKGNDVSDPTAIDALLDDLAGMQVDTLLINAPIYIDGLTGSEIVALHEATDLHPGADTPTGDELHALIEPALARGFGVWVRPLLDETRLHEESGGSAWRGMLAPADPDTFFANYTQLLLDLLGGASGASWLIIGTEFNSLQAPEYDSHWANLIAALRAASDEVALTYAVNWSSGEYPAAPPWFGLLDGISIDAYFPTGPIPADSSSDEIAANLRQWLPVLQGYRDAFPGLPLFITELGVASQEVDPPVLQRPWHAEASGPPPDPGVQRRYAEGACALYTGATATDGSPLIAGLFWWRTSVYPLAAPLDDLSHEFRGKPAGTAIAVCFALWGR